MKQTRYGRTLSIAVLLILLVPTALLFTMKKPVSTGTPWFIERNPTIKEAYEFAAGNPDALNGVPCRCGCFSIPHDGRLHKRGLLDCFFRDDGSYDIHASQCSSCIEDALKVKGQQ